MGKPWIFILACLRQYPHLMSFPALPWLPGTLVHCFVSLGFLFPFWSLYLAVSTSMSLMELPGPARGDSGKCLWLLWRISSPVTDSAEFDHLKQTVWTLKSRQHRDEKQAWNHHQFLWWDIAADSYNTKQKGYCVGEYIPASWKMADAATLSSKRGSNWGHHLNHPSQALHGLTRVKRFGRGLCLLEFCCKRRLKNKLEGKRYSCGVDLPSFTAQSQMLHVPT